MDNLEFVTRQLSKAQKKRHESYGAKRMGHPLNDLRIKIITPQYVK